MAANLDLFGIRLDDDDHATMARLDDGTRIGPDPTSSARERGHDVTVAGPDPENVAESVHQPLT